MSTKGKALTVTGLVDPDTLGYTTSHEHILFDLTPYFMEPASATGRGLARQPLALKNLAWARTHRFSNLDNMRQSDLQLAIDELMLFKCAGGNTVVEMSNHGLGRDPEGLLAIARTTGLNIIMGSGYYLDMSHPKTMDGLTEAQITEEIVRDITVGVPGCGIRAGIIGELGCSTPVTPNEKKVLRAGAAAQRATGAPMDIHPSFDDAMVLETAQLLEAHGADPEHTVISHMEMFNFTLETRLKLLDMGYRIAYDNFGNPGYPHEYLGKTVNLTSDLNRIRDIKELVDQGYLSQILLGHDVCFRDMLQAYSGYGYAHLLVNVKNLMGLFEITPDQFDAMMIHNPRQFLTFTK